MTSSSSSATTEMDRQIEKLRAWLSECIAHATALTAATNRPAVQRLISFLWAAQAALGQITTDGSLTPARVASGRLSFVPAPALKVKP